MKSVRRGMVVGLVLLTLAAATPLVVQWVAQPRGPSFSIVFPDGGERRITVAALRNMPQIVRRGEVENQFGNWRDAGTYSGVLLSSLLSGISYDAVDAVASDGYRVTIERSRVEDPAYPMVVAYAFDGASVPAWADGFRIVVLPEDGQVSNEEYQVVSAGSYWVKNVVQVVVTTSEAHP